MFSIIQELGSGTLVLHTNQIIGYHRLDTNSRSGIFIFGGCFYYNAGDGRYYSHDVGIFHYTQDDTTTFDGTGSRTNYELVNFRIIIVGGLVTVLLDQI